MQTDISKLDPFMQPYAKAFSRLVKSVLEGRVILSKVTDTGDGTPRFQAAIMEVHVDGTTVSALMVLPENQANFEFMCDCGDCAAQIVRRNPDNEHEA